MTKKFKQSFYIGWRRNLELPNGGYFKAFGQLSKADAKKTAQTYYGTMALTAYPDAESYDNALTEHIIKGYSIL
jgi:hypothetical protein